MVPCVRRRILEQKIVKNAKKAQYVFFAFFASKPAAPAMESIMLKHILIFIGPDYEDLELLYPRLRLIEAGMGVTTAGLVADTVYHGKNGYPCTSDAAIDDMEAADFEGVVIPGGWLPDKLRRFDKVKQLVRDFESTGKLIASICHGPWIDISAGVVNGYHYTSTPGIKDDLVNAGAQWSDQPVVVDRHHVSSRRPDDLPEFCKAMLKVLNGSTS